MVEDRGLKLRAVDARAIVQNGRPGVLLRDPLQLSDKTLVIPQPLHMVLALCDGTRADAGALSASLAIRHGVRVAPRTIEGLLRALDEAYLLDNAAYAEARERALAAYRSAPFRPPASAGQSYPEDAGDLKRLLDGYLDEVRAEPSPSTGAEWRGLVSPHIDYARGGTVYAQVWQRAAEAARVAEVAVILGTDHFDEGMPLTLTRQHYATPYGVLPTAGEAVDALAGVLGEDTAFAGELHHRSEHAIELAAVWLHHVRHGQACEVVPILCGSFQRFLGGDVEAANGMARDPARDPAIAAVVEGVRELAARRRVLVVAAADLGHVGPAFGVGPIDLVGRARLQAADEALIERMCAGDAAGFLGEIRNVGDRNNVCGVPPIYLALRALEPAEGERAGYERCPADGQGTSWVSVCGVVWR